MFGIFSTYIFKNVGNLRNMTNIDISHIANNSSLLKFNGLEMLHKLEKFKAPFIVVLNNYKKLKKLCRINKNVIIECFISNRGSGLAPENKIFLSKEFLCFFCEYAEKIKSRYVK